MKKLIALILAPLCLLGLVACFPVDPGYGNTVAYAGWSDDPTIADGALNKGQLANENGNHLPIFKFDTLDDLNQFKAKYDGVLALDQGYNSVLSFNEALTKAQWNSEGFFKDHSKSFTCKDMMLYSVFLLVLELISRVEYLNDLSLGKIHQL